MRASPTVALIALVLLAPVVAAASSAQRINGTKKADRIDAVYGGTDRVTCGKGVDAVTADPADAISGDCEVVSRRISSDSLTSAGAQHQTQVEPSVAGAGTTAVAAFQVGRFGDGGAAGIGWSTSTDSGRTWRSGIVPGLTLASKPAGDAPRASDPAVAYDAAHATWLIATLVLGSNYTGLGISRSNDGRSWSAPTFAARFASGSLAYDKEWVGCDNTTTSPFYGRCYLVYTDIATPRVAAQVSRDGGATWGAPVTVTSAFGIDAEGALPLIQPNGALTVVFVAGEAGIYAVRSVDGGATFGLPAGVSAISEAARPFLRAPPLPTAAVDASGRMYVAWADCVFRPGCNGNTIVLSTSVDGLTWTAPTRVPGTGFDSFVPGIAADPAKTGRLSLVTYVRNASSCAVTACTFGVSVTSSSDGGAHWTKPQRLDASSPRYTWTALAGGHFVGDYVGAAFAGGRFVPVFALASKPSASGQLREYMLAASLP
ncbi:MAG: sialidase family protein [Gaiellaceae bacterium]